MIEVFSKRKDKPRHYGFVALDEAPPSNWIDLDPVEFAISPDGKNWTSCYDVPNMEGIYCFDSPKVPIAKRTNNSKKFGLQDGSRLISTTYDSREIKFKLIYRGADRTDAMLAFETAQRFFVSREAYWLTFADWQGRMYYGLAEMGDPDFGVKDWSCEVTFTDLMGLGRSIGTSLGSTADLWGVNNNIPNNGDYPPFEFTTNTFSVYNLSDVDIDPERRGHDFKLTIKGSSSGKFRITNKSTGYYLYHDKSFDGELSLDGPNAEFNGQGALLDVSGTDGGVIDLKQGKNDFQVDNFSGTISFDFPFWWLS